MNMARFKLNKNDFEKYFKGLMYDTAFSMNGNIDLLLENKIFNYTNYFVEFFKYMDEHCSDKNTEYKSTSYLRNKINEFGDKFKDDYFNAFNKTKNNILKNYNEFERKEKAEELKKKFCGNLLEIINGFYAIDFTIIEGFEFDTWCNNTEDDFMGVDGILRRSCDKKIKIPMNTKHSNWNEIDKFVPFQKLGDWVKTYAFDKLNDEDTLTMKHLPYHSIIFTDNDSSDFSAEKFPKVYIVNDITLCKNLGKYGRNIGNVEIWKHWYKIVKKVLQN